MNKFPVQIQLGFQFKFKVISGESKDTKNHLGTVKTN